VETLFIPQGCLRQRLILPQATAKYLFFRFPGQALELQKTRSQQKRPSMGRFLLLLNLVG
jgi:hypothetical protein